MMIKEYSRAIMIEAIMHVYGACQPNPTAFRQWLDKLSDEDLTREYEDAMETKRPIQV